jgi:ubiquinone/menaquinone biosynthesis C-methylase UbiE
MGFHTFDSEKASKLEDESRYRFCSREELLSMVDPAETQVVADLGSGTGFYTDDVAPYVQKVYGVDVQESMHDAYREKGVPENVELVTADASRLPFEDAHLDALFTTMTYHEFAGEDAAAELARVVKPGGRLVVVDWAADGEAERGPPLEERYDVGHAISLFADASFRVKHAASRWETFSYVAIRS